MLRLVIKLVLWTFRAVFRSRENLVLENLALRQQLAVFKHSHRRPRVRNADRAFWGALKETWNKWADTLIIVAPDTVVRWHRRGFRYYWRWKSRPRRPGRPRFKSELSSRCRAVVRLPPRKPGIPFCLTPSKGSGAAASSETETVAVSTSRPNHGGSSFKEAHPPGPSFPETPACSYNARGAP